MLVEQFEFSGRVHQKAIHIPGFELGMSYDFTPINKFDSPGL
jgi:hypothetical protein